MLTSDSAGRIIISGADSIFYRLALLLIKTTEKYRAKTILNKATIRARFFTGSLSTAISLPDADRAQGSNGAIDLIGRDRH